MTRTVSNACKRFILVAIGFSSFATPVSLRAETLARAVQLGLQESPSVRKALAEASISFHEIAEAKSDRRPQVYVDATGGAAFRDRSIDGVQTGTGDTLLSREARVTIQQIVFDFGASRALVESADLRNQFHTMLVEDVKLEQALQIAETYIELFRLRGKVGEIRKHIVELTKDRDLAIEQSVADSNATALVIDSRIDSAKFDLSALDARILALSDRFRLLTTLDPGASMAMSRVPANLGGHVSIVETPKVRAAELAIKSSERDITAARRDMLPKFYVEGRGGLGQNVLGIEGQDNEWSGLGVFRWTPYLGGRKQAILDQQSSKFEADLAAKEEVIRSIRDSINLAQREIDGAGTRLRASRVASSGVAEALSKYQELLTTGDADGRRVGVLNLTNTRSEALSIKLNEVDARMDAYLHAVRGLAAGGTLIRYFESEK